MKTTLLFLSVFLSATLFGQDMSFSDSIEGYVYKTVTRHNRTWFAENLNVSNFRNGDPIPYAKTAEEWRKAGEKKKPAWCYYGHDEKNGTIYGKLYNWYAVNDRRGLAPEGWHVPSIEEWIHFPFYRGEKGEDLKARSGWFEGEEDGVSYSNGSNESGFRGLPGGQYLVIRVNGISYEPKFTGIGTMAYWWSSNKNARKSIRKYEIVNKMPKKEAYFSCLCGDVTGGAGCLGSFSEGYPFETKSSGLAVRLVKDSKKINRIDADAYFNRALDYISLRYYDKAIDDFTSAIKIKPDFVKAYFERGLIYYELGTRKHIYKDGSIARFYRKAINDFTSVIEIEPNNSDAYFERGCAKYKLYLEFCEDFKRACDLGSGKGCEYFKGEWDFSFSYENDGCD